MAKFIRQRGTLDIFDKNAMLYQYIIDTCYEVANSFNYTLIEVPTFEQTALYTRSTGETSDIVTKEMYDFLDKSGRNISLRPEGTAGVIRAIVENKLYATNDLPLRYFYQGSFFRYERPQVGRYREFKQFGVEVVGSSSFLDDIETVLMIKEILNKLEIYNYKVRINTFGNESCRNIHRNNIKEFFKAHIDNLCEDCKNRYEKNPLRILDCKVDKEYIEKLTVPVSLDALDDTNKQLFEKILNILKENDVKYEVDKYLVRGLDYYTGLIYEFDIETSDHKILTIGGGGRYSNLVKELDGPDLDCIGFGIGINRLAVILEDLYGLDKYQKQVKYYVMPLDESCYEISLKVANTLRNKGNVVALETNKRSVSSMFKLANKNNYQFAIMIGTDEINNNQVKIKNLVSQEQYYVDLKEILEGDFNG